MKDHLDRVEVGGILPQVAQACTDGLDGLLDAENPMGRKVVNHDNVSALERRVQALLKVGQKATIHSSVDQHRRYDPGMTQARDKSHGFPMSQRDISDQALSARTAAVRSHHVGADCGLVDEH